MYYLNDTEAESSDFVIRLLRFHRLLLGQNYILIYFW
jgi:hypothetical protein